MISTYYFYCVKQEGCNAQNVRRYHASPEQKTVKKVNPLLVLVSREFTLE